MSGEMSLDVTAMPWIAGITLAEAGGVNASDGRPQGSSTFSLTASKTAETHKSRIIQVSKLMTKERKKLTFEIRARERLCYLGQRLEIHII
jgi:hypothetical protein